MALEETADARTLTSKDGVVTIMTDGGIAMEKLVTFYLRVNPALKKNAESVLTLWGFQCLPL